MFERIPEPALMIDTKQCEIYNQEFIDDPVCLPLFILKYDQFIAIKQGTIVDLGSGSCNFVIELCKKYPKLNVVCYEDSEEMIRIAEKNILDNKVQDQIKIIKDDFFNADGRYDAVLANRVLHHVNDTNRFWRLINKLSERILVSDLERPCSINIVEEVSKNESIDFKNSLKAAYTYDEVQKQIKEYPYEIIKEIYSDDISTFNVITKKYT